MAFTGLGRTLFALGMIGLGVLSLIYGKYALQWQPVPAGWPLQLAYVSGAVLVLSGLGLWLGRAAGACAAVLSVFLGLWVVGLQLPVALASPGSVGSWLPLCEDLALMSGAWTLFAVISQGGSGPSLAFITDKAGLRIARSLFGISCLVFGASHFVYADFTAQMIPAWLPQRLWLAYLTGAGHTAAGVALLLGVVPRLAVTLEAFMMSSFLVLVHIPMVLGHPPKEAVQLYWTMLCVAAALSGTAWTISATLSDTAWGLKTNHD